jgi:hypothetical protein
VLSRGGVSGAKPANTGRVHQMLPMTVRREMDLAPEAWHAHMPCFPIVTLNYDTATLAAFWGFPDPGRFDDGCQISS